IRGRAVSPSPYLLFAMRYSYPLMKGTSEGSASSLLLEETLADRDGSAYLYRLDYGLTTEIVCLCPRSLPCVSLDIPARSLHPFPGLSVRQTTGNTVSITVVVDTTLAHACRATTMHKAERDDVMTCLSQADRDYFRHLVQDVRTRTTASRPGDAVRQMLTVQGH